MFNREILLKYKTSLIFGAAGIIFLLIFTVLAWIPNFSRSSGQKKSFEILGEGYEASVAGEIAKTIFVDLEGAVENPGVYELEEGARVAELLDRAGGLLDGADHDHAAKVINKAQKLSDGVKIYIPFKGEEVKETSSESYSGKININTASAKELESLSGVGEKTAEKIIDNRPYASIEELADKKVIYQSTFEKIKGKITVF